MRKRGRRTDVIVTLNHRAPSEESLTIISKVLVDSESERAVRTVKPRLNQDESKHEGVADGRRESRTFPPQLEPLVAADWTETSLDGWMDARRCRRSTRYHTDSSVIQQHEVGTLRKVQNYGNVLWCDQSASCFLLYSTTSKNYKQDGGKADWQLHLYDATSQKDAKKKNDRKTMKMSFLLQSNRPIRAESVAYTWTLHALQRQKTFCTWTGVRPDQMSFRLFPGDAEALQSLMGYTVPPVCSGSEQPKLVLVSMKEQQLYSEHPSIRSTPTPTSMTASRSSVCRTKSRSKFTTTDGDWDPDRLVMRPERGGWWSQSSQCAGVSVSEVMWQLPSDHEHFSSPLVYFCRYLWNLWFDVSNVVFLQSVQPLKSWERPALSGPHVHPRQEQKQLLSFQWIDCRLIPGGSSVHRALTEETAASVSGNSHRSLNCVSLLFPTGNDQKSPDLHKKTTSLFPPFRDQILKTIWHSDYSLGLKRFQLLVFLITNLANWQKSEELHLKISKVTDDIKVVFL